MLGLIQNEKRWKNNVNLFYMIKEYIRPMIIKILYTFVQNKILCFQYN